MPSGKARNRHRKVIPIAYQEGKPAKVPLSQRRTRRLDDEKEVLLGKGPGGPIHTTAGEMNLNEGDKEQLSVNLKDQKVKNLVTKMAKAVLEDSEQFFNLHTYKNVPVQVITKGDAVVAQWLKENGFTFKFDEFTSVVLQRGKVVAINEFPVFPQFRKPVLQAMDIMTGRLAQ